MATNEIYKYGQWISLPLPLRGDDPHKNADPTRNGDPVLIGDIVGVAQEVGGVSSMVDTGTVVTVMKRNTADSLEPGWASVALCGAWAIPVDGFDQAAHGAGTAVGIVAAKPDQPAKLVIGAGDHPFGMIIGWTKMPVKKRDQPKHLYGVCDARQPKPVKEPVPIVNIVQTVTGAVNDVPDKPAGS